jgi:hypothetical protein
MSPRTPELPAAAATARAGRRLLLLPLVFPAILLPAMLNWVSGNAAQRAKKAEEERKGRGSEPVLSQAKA